GIDVRPLLRGGTGGDSLLEERPEAYPDHLEAGSGNGPGIAGLLAGVEWLSRRGSEARHRSEQALKQRLHAGLARSPGIRVRSPLVPEGVGIVTFTSERMAAADHAARLEREHGVQCRAGLHCAPEAHRVLGTLEEG